MSIQNTIGYLVLVLLCIFIIIYNTTNWKPYRNATNMIEGLTSPAPSPSSSSSNGLSQFQMYNLIDYRSMDQDMWQLEQQILKIQEIWPLNINSVNVSSSLPYIETDKLNQLQSMCTASDANTSLSYGKIQNTNSPVVHPPNLDIKYNTIFPNIGFDFTLIKAEDGPQGDQGEQGVQGDQGPVGPSGIQGPNGYWNIPIL